MPKKKQPRTLKQPILQSLVVGSPAWIEAVYGGVPARDVDGSKSRPTQRSHSIDDGAIATRAIEGRLETTSVHLLDWLRNTGAIKRFKVQPFSLQRTVHGIEATPDFIAEDGRGQQVVIEAKPVGDLTPEEQAQQDEVARVASLARMKFALWTDQWPLTRVVFTNLWHMRRAQKLFTKEEIACVKQVVERSAMSLGELQGSGYSLDLLHAASYQGAVFFNFFQRLTDDSPVSLRPDERIITSLLQGWHRVDLVWEGLPSTQC